MNDLCPLCNREMIEGPSVDQHHLVPRAFGGKIKENIHVVCHRKLHSVFTEREMFQYYHTWSRLKENDKIKTFIKWISKKHPEYVDNHKDAKDKRAKRKR